MTESSVIKVLEIMPKNAMTLRHVLAREKRTYSDEDIAKILELTRESKLKLGWFGWRSRRKEERNTPTCSTISPAASPTPAGPSPSPS